MFSLHLYTLDIFHDKMIKNKWPRYFLITSLLFINFVDLGEIFYLLESLFP